MKIKAKKEHIVGLITVEKFDLANSICKSPILWSLCWSRHDHRRWQSYHVQAQNKSSWLQTKVQILRDLSKTWVLAGKQFEDFRQKRTETLFSTFQKTQVEHKDTKSINWTWFS